MGIVATMFVRYPKAIDFSCGFQSDLPSGTCSKAWRERSASRFISASKKSFRFMLGMITKERSRDISECDELLNEPQRGGRVTEPGALATGSRNRRWIIDPPRYAAHPHPTSPKG